MRYFCLLALFCFSIVTLSAQQLTRERIADLQPLDYAIQGDAILEEYDDGTLKLRLTADFDTPSGPDVRMFLSNGSTATGAVEVADLSEVNHFSGARTFDVPAGVTLEQFSRVFFYCRAFGLPWAVGTLGEPTTVSSGFECLTSSTFSTDGATSVSVCPSDGNADLLTLGNSLGSVAGEHYAYLITDTNEIVLEVVTDDTYDFDGSGLDEQRVYGMHYDGELTAVTGANRMQTTASGCYTHAPATDFLTVTKDGCEPAFECRESLVATYNWVTEVDVCSTDGAMDTVFLQNNIDVAVGDHYVFLLTDTNEIVREVITTAIHDFENSGAGKVRVYGLHFDGELLPAIGENRRNTTATGCSLHSGDETFITIDRTGACPATSVIDRALAVEVAVYPNPAADLIKVELPETFKPGNASIMDALGRIVITKTISGDAPGLQLSVADLPAGHYTLRLEDKLRVAVKRILVVR